MKHFTQRVRSKKLTQNTKTEHHLQLILLVILVIFTFYLNFKTSPLISVDTLIVITVSIATIATTFCPIKAGCIAAIICAAAWLIPKVYAVNLVWVSIGSLTLLAYKCNKQWISFLACLINITCFLISSTIIPQEKNAIPPSFSIILIVFFAFSILLGRSFAWRDQAINAQELKLKLNIKNIKIQQYEQRNRLADNLHNHVANNLTYIYLIALQNGNDKDCLSIKQASLDALDSLHSIIAILDHDVDITQNENTRFPQKFTQCIQTNTARLNKININGICKVNGSLSQVQIHADIILTTLSEIYTNIMRHCPQRKSNAYSLNISFSTTECGIVEMNPYEDKLNRGGSSGSGITRIRHMMKQCDGHIHITCADGGYMIQCRIPIASIKLPTTME